MSETLLSARDLSVGYHGRPLLREICLQVHPGEILTLIGPNGAGKSTILNSLIGQLRLLGGQVSLLGRDIVRLSEREIARSLSVMMTGRAQPDRMTCWEVAAAGRYPYTGRLGILGPGDRAAVRAALERVRALELRDAPFDQISDGQRQRVLLARAICQEPEVLVLDEPTSFLDLRGKLELLDILKELVRERQVAVVLSLHELDLAQRISDRILRPGRGDRPVRNAGGDLLRGLYPAAVRRGAGQLLRVLRLSGAGAHSGRTPDLCHRRKRHRDPGLPQAPAAGSALCRRDPAGKRRGSSGGLRPGCGGDRPAGLSPHRGGYLPAGPVRFGEVQSGALLSAGVWPPQ